MKFTLLKKIRMFLMIFSISLLISLAACNQVNNTSNVSTLDGKLKIVATTTIVADVVSQVGGEYIDLDVLLPIGADPHGFDPTPQDIAMVADADVVFANGAGLEEFLEDLIESAGADKRTVHVSSGIDLISLNESHDEEMHDEDSHEEETDHEHTGVDPHTWTDPNNVIIWVRNIQDALSEIDPSHTEQYSKNAESYTEALKNLDKWVVEQVLLVPADQRVIVTDHTLYSYFNEEYGFTQIGAIIPGYSSMAEPTAKELATLEDAINDMDVPAVFVGNTVNPSLAERVTEDTGTQLIYLYTGSLSEQDGPASTYLDYIRYNVEAIVENLK